MSANLGFGVVGAGRIGRLHARHLAGAIDGARLLWVMDAMPEAAAAAAYGSARTTNRLDDLLADPAVDALLIASPTPLHAAQIRAAATAGKAIFCEKPIALSLADTLAAMEAIEEAGVPFQVGFNRRFDPGYVALARAVHEGELGKVEMFRSQSSDPAPPPRDYAAASGGIYLDSVIHDIDTARFVAGEITRVTALGRVLAEPYLADVGDIDTSILTLEFASGALGVIQNSRRTVYGYDLRLEVHCEKGKLLTEDERATKLWTYDRGGVRGDYYHYFLDRFKDAYRAEVQAFTDAVCAGRPPGPGPRDAVESLRVALAATRSLHEARPVPVSEVT
ncbi:MAG TPA: inositol 2-dehydrogenase [Trueperaceae bacterium]